MFKLDTLTEVTKSRRRIGRGGSRGGTAGRGHKGQRARTSGNVRRGFEGGQMVLARRLPRRGFTNAPFKASTAIVSLQSLDSSFADGAHVTVQELIAKGLIKPSVERVKVLGGGELSKKLVVTVHAFSKSAQDTIVKLGGQAQIIKG